MYSIRYFEFTSLDVVLNLLHPIYITASPLHIVVIVCGEEEIGAAFLFALGCHVGETAVGVTNRRSLLTCTASCSHIPGPEAGPEHAE